FLLARLHIDALVYCLTPREIQHALHTLSIEINATHDNAMARIEKLSVNRQKPVKKLLMWASYARRQITVRELKHATAISRGAHDIHPDTIISAKMLTSRSAGLAIIDKNEYMC
ncbi:hypothetical protein CC86DRAFT_295144, partial [Ophiobolus disseminans]